jgi:hypothetical protein
VVSVRESEIRIQTFDLEFQMGMTETDSFSVFCTFDCVCYVSFSINTNVREWNPHPLAQSVRFTWKYSREKWNFKQILFFSGIIGRPDTWLIPIFLDSSPLSESNITFRLVVHRNGVKTATQAKMFSFLLKPARKIFSSLQGCGVDI